MKYGETEEIQSERDAKPSRRKHAQPAPIPNYMKDKPELDTALLFYWEGFINLSTERKVDGGPIPYLSAVEYCKLHYVADHSGFFKVIKQMDAVFLKNQKEKISNDT